MKTIGKASVENGLLIGSEADFYDSETLRVWTPELRKARFSAKQFGLRIKEYDTEADLLVPLRLWPKIAKRFGLPKNV